MKKFLVNEELLVQIANYLSAKPYAEVFKFIEALKILEPEAEQKNVKSDKVE